MTYLGECIAISEDEKCFRGKVDSNKSPYFGEDVRIRLSEEAHWFF